MLPLPDEMLIHHATLYEDYKNTTHWPKHVLVHYHWLDEGDIDFNKGLYVLMTTGVYVCSKQPTSPGDSSSLLPEVVDPPL